MKKLLLNLGIVLSLGFIFLGFETPAAASCYECKKSCQKDEKVCKKSAPSSLCKLPGSGLVCYMFRYVHCFRAKSVCYNVRCELDPECDPDPKPPKPGGRGEPHFDTIDGMKYDFQAVGEFIFVRSKITNYEIQIRLKKYNDQVSTIDVVALRFGKNTIIYYGETFYVNGEKRSIPAEGIKVSDIKIQKLNSHRFIITANQHQLWINDNGQRLNLSFGANPTTKNNLSGLLGNFNGNPKDDLQDRKGVVFNPTQLTHETLYQKFGMSWRLSSKESFLPYRDNENTKTFTDLEFPKKDFYFSKLDSNTYQSSKNACENSNVPTENLRDCIYDFSVAGDGQFIPAYLVERASGNPTYKVRMQDKTKKPTQIKNQKNALPTLTLRWTSSTDLDLHLKLPSGIEISPDISDQRQAVGVRMVQDACYSKVKCDAEKEHLEKIQWTEKGFVEGKYKVWAENFDARSNADFVFSITFPDGYTRNEKGTIPASKTKSEIFEFSYPRK